ncbi:fatty acid-binding protein 10-A, liver basic-like [Osmerus eperlanus]|uniref:fatty acid-binding protein 10-A, liver basic-like n=1 Tax=Osmerus eperlanus TaxID=29151 RepID=UPI002E106381
MDFSGKWEIYAQENHEEFLQKMEVPQMLVKMMKDVKPVTVIEQNGDDFTIKIQTSLRTVTNSFTVGRESEMTSMDGRKFQCTPSLEDGKLVITTEKFTSMRKIIGEDMIETISAGSTVMTRRSRRV